MFIGVGRFTVQVPGARSLKEKRRVVRSLKDRIRNKFPVAVAEVGDADKLQLAVIGVAAVSSDQEPCTAMLSKIEGLVAQAPGAVLADVATEVVPMGAGGHGVQGDLQQRMNDELPAHWRSDDDR